MRRSLHRRRSAWPVACTAGARVQRGAIAITMMLMLIGLIAMLGLLEVGQLYSAKRSTQQVADLAALAGAQQLQACTAASNDDNAAARGNAVVENHFGGMLAITCGTWDPVANAGIPDHFGPVAAGDRANAVKVVAESPVSPIWGFAWTGSHITVSAQAVAADRGEPIAAFSVGSRLLGTASSSPIEQLLDSALGTSLGLKLLSYEGVANSSMSLLGLTHALSLDAGTVDGVLDTQVRLGDFLNAAVQVLEQGGNLANVEISNARTQIASLPVQVANTLISLGDILNVNAGTNDPNTALDVNVNAADILSAALQAGNSKSAVALQVSDLDLLGLAKANLKLAIIEPPKISIGRAGYNPDGTPLTIAHTAQIRLQLGLSLVSPVGGGNDLLNLPLLLRVSLPSTALSTIPLNLELVPAEAWLDSLQCRVPDAASGKPVDLATLKLQPGALNAFLGNLPDTTYSNEHHGWQDIVDAAIADDSAYAHLVQVQVDALLSLVSTKAQLDAYASAPVVRSSPATHTFQVDAQTPVAQQPDQLWSADTGQDLLASALSSLFTSNVLKARLGLDGLGLAGNLVAALASNLAPIVTGVLGVLSPVFSPVFSTLDTALVGPLLHLLGVDVGATDVHLMSVQCNNGVQLVY